MAPHLGGAPQAPMKLRTLLLDCFLVSLLAVALIWPLFKTKYQASWHSIESTFISDGRFLAENWPHPRWQPLWYCGTRFDYVYPPALRYGTAGLTKLFPIVPARAYHLYVAFFYCLGIGGVYLLAALGGRSRGAGWLAAAAVACVSPSILFIEWARREAQFGHMLPQRLGVLIRYGEGPHMTALALLGFALAAAFVGLRRGRSGWLAAAAVLAAMVVSTNFYGATSLALFFPVLVWAIWLEEQDKAVWLRAAAIALLAYGLTAFWLTPSYLQITTENLKFVAEPAKPWSIALLAAVAAGFAFITWRFTRGRKDSSYLIFVTGGAVLLGLNVLGHNYFGFRAFGLPSRLVPELDLAMILLLVELLRRAWLRAPRTGRIAMVLLVAVAFIPARHYYMKPWRLAPRDPNFKERIEYRVTEWVSKNLPDTRTLATGSVRFWYNAWFDLPQVGGGSEQGLTNYATSDALWAITADKEVGPDVQWMQATGAGAIIVHEKPSKEIYHDYKYPERFHGKLPVLFDSGEGDFIYQIPRRFPERARVVETARMPAASHPERLSRYVDAIERGPDARALLWREGTDAMRVTAATATGQSIVVQETWDPYWRAYENGRRLETRRDAMGMIEILVPPGIHDIRLAFELPLENAAGRVLFVLSGLIVMLLFLRARHA